MAEVNATETTMPNFVRAGMDFFTGKTVLASTLQAETDKLNAALARIATLEAANSDAVAMAAQIDSLKADVASRDSQIAAHKAKIESLSAEFQTAAKQAQIQIAKAGATPPVVTEAPKDEAKQSKFSELVAAKVSAGKGKATAIAEVIKESPAAYAEWLKGDTSKI